MNRLARWMMRLYPARWRERYGDELDVLISDAGADVRTVADLAKGGIRMQFSTWSFAKLAVVLGIAGVFLGAAASFLSKPVYESKAKLVMEGTPEQRNGLIEWAEPLLLSRSELSSIINDPRLLLYREEMKIMPLQDVIERMKNNIRIAAGSGQTIDISFRYPDAMTAQQTAASLADRLIAMSVDERAARSSETPHPHLDVVDEASLPTSISLERTLERVGFLFGVSIPLLWRGIRHKQMLSWWLLLSIPICAVLGIVGGDFILLLQNREVIHFPGYRYRSTATMEVAGATQKQIQDLADGVLAPASLSTIILDRRLLLYSDKLKSTPIEDAVQEMNRHLTITPVPGHPNFVTIAFEYKDRFKAQQTVVAVMNRVNDLWKQSTDRTAIVPLGTWGPVSIQSPPSPSQPIATDRYQYAGTGGLVGVIVAGFIALIRRRWTPEQDDSANAMSA